MRVCQAADKDGVTVVDGFLEFVPGLEVDEAVVVLRGLVPIDAAGRLFDQGEVEDDGVLHPH